MNPARALPFPSFVQAAAPGAGAAGRLAEALAMSLVVGLAAQLELRLPFTPVPITGQTAAVLLAGALLGRRWGTLAVAFYLAEGCLGFPFFAGGAAGAWHLAGPTGGYLVGFLAGAWVTGTLAERGWGRGFASAAAMLALGSAAVFACGALRLAAFVPRGQVLALGVLPFLAGDALKTLLGAAALPALWKSLGRSPY